MTAALYRLCGAAWYGAERVGNEVGVCGVVEGGLGRHQSPLLSLLAAYPDTRYMGYITDKIDQKN